jgi:hypothetical protein
MYGPVNTSHEIFRFGRILERRSRSKRRDAIFGLLVLRKTISINPNYSGLVYAHYLPADGADSLVDMTDRRKSENPDSLLRIYQ